MALNVTRSPSTRPPRIASAGSSPTRTVPVRIVPVALNSMRTCTGDFLTVAHLPETEGSADRRTDPHRMVTASASDFMSSSFMFYLAADRGYQSSLENSRKEALNQTAGRRRHTCQV